MAAVSIGAGWANRNESNLVPDEGLGYALGVAGLSCMTLLLAYSLRKRIRGLRHAGRVSSWFQIHMMLGLAGPVLILYHCNFRLGSQNSNVALLCALVVASSGVVGRLIYTRIHHGLSDRRTTLSEVTKGLEDARDAIADQKPLSELLSVLRKFEERSARRGRDPLRATWSFVTLGIRCRRTRRRALRGLRRAASEAPEIAATRNELRGAITRYVDAVRRTETLGVYERIFALWHVLHLPLTTLLFAAAAVHVVAVHMY